MRRRYPAAIREIEERWAALETGPRALSEREAHELAAPIYDCWIALHGGNPSQNPWQPHLFERLWRSCRAGLWSRSDVVHQVLHGEFADLGEDDMEALCLEQADRLIEKMGLLLDKDSRRVLAKAVSAVIPRASLILGRYALGNLSDETPATRPPSIERAPAPPTKVNAPVEFDDLVKGWAAERKPVVKTLYDWKRVMTQLADFLGHRDATQVTSEGLIA